MTASLRKGARGAPVRTLQEALRKQGFAVTADGVFGSRTDIALRNYQINQGLLGDGIAGPRTLAALGIAQSPSHSPKKTPQQNRTELHNRIGLSANRVRIARPKPIIQPSKLVGSLSLSRDGYYFVYTHEAWINHSNRPHWPGGKSGVTIGAGYDLRHRTKQEVISAMQAIGANDIAAELAEGIHLHHELAYDFCSEHRHLRLTPMQEFKLLEYTAPTYEQMVRDGLNVELHQHEYDALVCFVYNIGSLPPSIASAIKDGKIADAMTNIKLYRKSDGKVNKGLVNRREHEVSLYLENDYGQLRIPV